MKQLDILIPTELIELIAIFYKIQIESKILSDDESVIFYDMICKQLNVKAIEWRLTWRGNDDGFDFDSFWDKCDKVSPSIVIVETKKCDAVFGGFTKVGLRKYETHQYTQDKDAFLYSLRKKDSKNKEKHEPKIYPIKSDQTEYALCFVAGDLCCFGGGSGSDLWIGQNCNIEGSDNGSEGCSYGLQSLSLTSDGCDEFIVNEMEIFQLNYCMPDCN